MHCLHLSLHKRVTYNLEAKEEHADTPFNSMTSLSLSQRHKIMFLAKHTEQGSPIPKFLRGSTKARKRNSILISTFKRIPIKQEREKKPLTNTSKTNVIAFE